MRDHVGRKIERKITMRVLLLVKYMHIQYTIPIPTAKFSDTRGLVFSFTDHSIEKKSNCAAE